jgi:hypothetical protein
MSNETNEFLGISRQSSATGPAQFAIADEPAPPVAFPPMAGGWPATSGKPRAVVTSSTLVRSVAGEQGTVACMLNADDEVDLGNTKKAEGKKWCAVALRDGQQGYIAGDTPIRTLPHVKLDQAEAAILPGPEQTGDPGQTMKRGASFLILKTIEVDGRKWVKIRDANGREGYMDGEVKIQNVAAKGANSPEHDMIVGALWCIGGIVVTVATYSAVARSGGTYFVAWGAVLSGGIQFLKGLFRAISE